MRKTTFLCGAAMLGTVLLSGTGITSAFCKPPIRCIHQTTVIRQGKAMTHLVLTVAASGAGQTPQNTADVVYQGVMRTRPYSQASNQAGEIVTNKDASIAVVHFDDYVDQITSTHCPLYLFLATQKGLTVLPDFGAQITRYLATVPIRHNDGTHWPLKLWTPRQLYVMSITGRILDIRIGAAEVTEGTAHLTVANDGKLKFVGYEEEGE